MKELQASEITESVKKRYGDIAKQSKAGCCGSSRSCCGVQSTEPSAASSLNVGYSTDEVQSVPSGSDLGLGCGNPHAIAALQAGETVLDLGSGAGIDCFLAAGQVGSGGRVIGVDMTPEMIDKARENAETGAYSNVEFRLGDIERLPVSDASVDVIISNCVVNLSPDKRSVFADAFRVLKPGGRLAISDVIATAPLPEAVRNDLALYSSCMGGALTVVELESMLAESGFRDIRIEPKDGSEVFIREWAPGRKLEEYIASATIEAVKPKADDWR